MTLRLNRCVVAIVTLLGLASCAQQEDNFLVQIAREGAGDLLGGVLGGDDGKTTAAPQPVTRAQLDEVPGPLLALSFEDIPAKGIIIGVNATPDGYVTYVDQTRRSVILHGGLITGLQGFRYDLSSVKTQQNDPTVRRTPVAKWPETLFRVYHFSLQSADDFQIAVKCTITPIVQEQIVVFEQSLDVMRVQEDCANDRRKFTNVYWAEPDTGRIWRSRQWLGPYLRPALVEVIRAYEPPANRT